MSLCIFLLCTFDILDEGFKAEEKKSGGDHLTERAARSCDMVFKS